MNAPKELQDWLAEQATMDDLRESRDAWRKIAMRYRRAYRLRDQELIDNDCDARAKREAAR